MSQPKTGIELVLRWLDCVHRRGHDFSQSDTCSRCGAHKGDATMLDVISHAKVKKGNPYAQ